MTASPGDPQDQRKPRARSLRTRITGPADSVVGSERPRRERAGQPTARQLSRASSQARKAAGARRNLSVVGYETAVPPWLRAAGDWSWRWIVMVIAVGSIVYATAHVKLVFIAIFIALVVASVLRPVTDLYSKVMPRPIAVALALLSATAVVGGLLTYVISSVAGQWDSLAKQFNSGVDQILSFLKGPPFHLQLTADDFNKWVENGRDWLQAHSGDIATQAAASAGSVFEVLAALALAFFCTIFFLASGRNMWVWFLNQLPARYRNSWAVAGGAGWYTFSGYARGTVIIALTDGILAGVFLAILRVPLAAPLGVLVFIGAFIPIIGAPLAMVIAAVVALAAKGPITALVVVVGIAAIGQFEGHILQPLIMGRQVSLHPMVVAIAVTTGTLLGGFLGAIIAVPVVAVVWAVFSTLRHKDPPMDTDPPWARDVAAGRN